MTPSQGTQAMPSTCASCGSPIPAGAMICASCGTPVSNEAGGWKLETVTADPKLAAKGMTFRQQ
ncbi:MAG: zinc-ribbon domain-containing protein [Candidatus Eremiobacteraeota bacterium]|nr:zinc-ribbon domain-containing protein [Candidatus Eremiobacteraeota bacterium]